MKKIIFTLLILLSSSVLAKEEQMKHYKIWCADNKKAEFSFDAFEYQLYKSDRVVIFKTIHFGEIMWARYHLDDSTCDMSVVEVTQ